VRRTAALLFTLWLLALPTAAHAFGVATASRDYYFVRWQSPKISYLLHQDGSADISNGSDLDAVRDGFKAWQAIECSAVEFEEKGYTTNRNLTAVGDMNGKNELAWIEGNEWPHGEYVLGVTGPIYGLNGIIVEADIGFNGLDYRWSTSGTPSFGNVQDVLNVAIHEEGHMFGLQHALWDFDQSNPPTMAPAADPYLKTRTLEDDDKLGACFLYPIDGVYTCESHGDCGKLVTQSRRGQEQYSGYGQCLNRSCQMVDSPPLDCGPGGMGAECDDQVDCDCVLYCQDLYERKICTRTCMTDSDDCPDGFACRAFNASTAEGFCFAASCGENGSACAADKDCCSSACVKGEEGAGSCAPKCDSNEHCGCEEVCEQSACRPGENPRCAPQPAEDAGVAPDAGPAPATDTGEPAAPDAAAPANPGADAAADAAAQPGRPNVPGALRPGSSSGGCGAGVGPTAGVLMWLLSLGLLARALRRRRGAGACLVAFLVIGAAGCKADDSAIEQPDPGPDPGPVDTAPWNLDKDSSTADPGSDTDAPDADLAPLLPPPWIASFHQGEAEAIHAMAVSGEAVIVAGDTSIGEGARDIGVAKIDGDGGMIWQMMIGGASSDQATDIVPTSSGFAVLGNTGPPHGSSAVSPWVLRIDALGRVLSQTVVGSDEWESVHGGAAVGEDIVLAGSTTVEGGATDVWAARLDAHDQIAWQLRAGGAEADEALHVVATGSGFVVVGQTRSFVKGPVGDIDLWVLALSSNGEVRWQWALGGTDVDRPEHVAKTGDGGLLIAGDTKSYGTGGHDGWLLKIHATSGDVIWQRAYGGAKDDTFDAVVEMDGGLLAVGRTDSFGVPASGDDIAEAWLVKLSKAGDIEWSRRYGVPGHLANAVAVAPALGGLVFAGFTGDSEQSDWMVARLPLSGLVEADCKLAIDTAPLAVPSGGVARVTAAVTAQTSAIAVSTAAIQQPTGFARTAMCGR
jgi:hypothetical protein